MSYLKTGLVFFVCFVLLLVAVNGCSVHPICTSHCDQRPEYWYNMPVPGSRYTEQYQTTVDGKPLPPVNQP